MLFFTNQDLAQLMRKVAAAYEIRGESIFRQRAYGNAADAIEHATSEVKDLWEDGELRTIPGIGSSLAAHLNELFTTGRVRHFEDVLQGLPEAMFPLLEVSGIGPKTAFKLVTKLKITNSKSVFSELLAAAKAGKIAQIPGFGAKSEAEVIESLTNYLDLRSKPPRLLLPVAEKLFLDYQKYLLADSNIVRADALGSLRRRVATVGDIDIAIIAQDRQAAVKRFVSYDRVDRILDAGEEKASIVLKNGCQVDLKVGRRESYGALLQHFTGSKNHNIHLRELALAKGLSLSEHGIKILKTYRSHRRGSQADFDNEKAFYNFLGLDFIPPELREDQGELERAAKRSPPQLVELNQIKGDFHIHSDFNIEPGHDLGENNLEGLIEIARQKKYEFIAIADHNPSSSRHDSKQIYNLIKARNNYIEQYLSSRGRYENEASPRVNKVFIIKSLEVDIQPNGNLAITPDAAELLDGVIASVHSAFSQTKEAMTQRLTRAISQPKVKIIGHPTGRLIQKREAYELDWDRIFAACLKYDVALEINACPLRLDLPDLLVREAVKRGVKLCLGTDSHSLVEHNWMNYGLDVARRGWASPKSVINTWDLKKILEWLRKKKVD